MEKSLVKLTNRMKLLRDFSLENTPFWDLCCDHGKIGFGVLKIRNNTHVYFVDCIETIIKETQQKAQYYLSDEEYCRAHFYCLKAEDITMKCEGVILIAGVGGLVITKILTSLFHNKKLMAEKIILSPYTDIALLENFLETGPLKDSYECVLKNEFIENKRCRNYYVIERKNN